VFQTKESGLFHQHLKFLSNHLGTLCFCLTDFWCGKFVTLTPLP
jgi:hypothetical protein